MTLSDTGPGEHGLASLLDGLTGEERARATRLVTYLRLMRDDARGLRPGDVGIDAAGARLELDRRRRRQRLAHLGELLRAYLSAALPADSFHTLGERTIGARDVTRRWWTLLAAESSASAPTPVGPEPGESALAVAQRLLVAAVQSRPDAAWRELWELRLASVRHGFASQRERWCALRDRARADRDLRLESLATAALVRTELDRQGVRGARDLLEERPLLQAAVPELARLRGWVALLLGDEELAHELLMLDPGAPDGAPPVLPLPLAELRDRVPRWVDWLRGDPYHPRQAHPEAPREAPVAGALASRRSLGASVLGVFGLDECGAVRPLVWDVAPGAWERVRHEWDRREGSWTEVGSPEHRVLVQGHRHIEHRLGSPLRSALAGAQSLVVGMLPLREDARPGPARGWVHLECEHHLLPSAARLRALASAWTRELTRTGEVQRIAEARPDSDRDTRRGAQPAEAKRTDPAPPGGESDAWRVRRALRVLRAQPLGLGRRRALLFDVEQRASGAPVLRLLAQHGIATGAVVTHGLGEPRPGAVPDACLRTAAPWRHAGEPHLALLEGARSGLAVPLVVAGRVHAVLALESARARDFERDELQRLARFGEAQALAWRLAQFRAWCLGRGHDDPWVDPASFWLAPVMGHWIRLARSGQPILLQGPAGSGRRTWSRWVHFEGAGAHAPLLETDDPWGDCAEPAEPAARPSWILDPCSPQGHAARLLRRSDPSGPRPLARLCGSLSGALRGGRLAPEVAALFEGFELSLPALCDRRDEIPGLAARLARNEARRLDCAPIELRPDALELLWRQPWPGNVTQLASWLRGLTVARPGTAVGAEDLRATARRSGRRLRERMPSARPRTLDLELALHGTRHANGRWNRAAAARRLGWDPATLRQRMAELGLGEPRARGGARSSRG